MQKTCFGLTTWMRADKSWASSRQSRQKGRMPEIYSWVTPIYLFKSTFPDLLLSLFLLSFPSLKIHLHYLKKIRTILISEKKKCSEIKPSEIFPVQWTMLTSRTKPDVIRKVLEMTGMVGAVSKKLESEDPNRRSLSHFLFQQCLKFVRNEIKSVRELNVRNFFPIFFASNVLHYN